MTCVSDRSGIASTGNVLERVEAVRHDAGRREQDEHAVVGAEPDDGSNHGPLLSASRQPAPAPGREGRERGLQARFRVEQEVGRRHDPVALGEAAQHLVAVGDLRADLDVAGFDRAVRAIEEDEPAIARVDDGAVGHHQALALLDVQHDVAEHVRLERPALVGHVDADLDRARGAVDGRGDVRHLAAPLPARLVRERHRRRHAEPDAAEVGLVDVGQHPDVREVGDLEDGVGRHHAHALHDGLRRDEAADLGVQVEGAADRPRALELGDVGRADVPEAQPFPRGLQQVRAALGDRGNLAPSELLLRPKREQVLLLGGDEFGAVDREQPIALLHVLAGEVHVEALDVALELRVHVGEAPLVGSHAADRADGAVDARLADLLAAHAEEGAPLGRQRDHGAALDCRARAATSAAQPVLSAAGIGSRSISQIGQVPLVSETTVGCMGQWYFADAAAGFVSTGGVVPAALIGTSFMPQMGQSPALSETTVGCMGQWYFAAAAEPAAP